MWRLRTLVPSAQSLDRRLLVEGAMGSVVIVVTEEGLERLCSLPRAGVGSSVGPLSENGLHEAFGLAVRAGRVGARPEVTEASLMADRSEGVAAVPRAVVGEQALDADPVTSEEGQSVLEEERAALARLIG